MPLNIIRGKKAGAIRAVIYGTEGIGKSTLAAQIPGAVIIDTEDGTGQIDAARVLALDWRAIEHAVKELTADPQGFSAVVIDTADWLEKALIEHVLRQAGKKSIEDFGYGKGYTILQEHVVRFLGSVDALIAKGVHVVFVAHSKVTRTSPPDQTDGYDRFELKLTKQVAPLLKEWADLVLFCNYRVQIVEGTDGRLKAQGGRERIMHAVHSAAWDAKNRFGLPDELPMEFAKIAHLFTGQGSRTEPEAKAAAVEAALIADPKPAPAPAQPAPPAKPEMIDLSLATRKQVEQLDALRGEPGSRAFEVIDDYMERLNALDFGELTTEQAAELLKLLQNGPAGWEKHSARLAWLEQNSEAATAYLQRVGWVSAGQTWRDLPADRVQTCVEKWDKFTAAVLAPAAKTGRKAA
jgi:hypothetical protein